MSELRIDVNLLEEVTARLDLRAPNRDAIESVVIAASQHYDVEGATDPFECVVDSATGVGKTYILAGLIEYFAAAEGTRNFAVITPGAAILTKTVANFTVGSRRSLLDPMEARPVVITAENFASPVMRAAIDDPTRVKLYIFTVQSLIRPTSRQGRRTHEFHEGLGGEFYATLADADDLVVFADEHHVYAAPAFSRTVRELDPRLLVGLTATPARSTPEEQIVYRYPLAAAIADQWVKTPVVVGRKDDRTDVETKLADGIALLEAKRAAIDPYREATGAAPVNPMMLVIARDIADADEVGAILQSSSFDGGRWADNVLIVTSASPDEALGQLEHVEDPDSPTRIIVSVGMLKEGWDVKSVYVIVSLRASVSEILTEQTLGRGMRLPWDEYTGWEMLDTLEVIAHERYEELLRRENVLNEAFVDHRAWIERRLNARGEPVATRQTSSVSAPVHTAPGDESVGAALAPEPGTLTLASTEERITDATAAVANVRRYEPDPERPILVPRLSVEVDPPQFSLSNVTDDDVFVRLARQIAADPEGELRRTLMGARIREGLSGDRHVEIVRSEGADRVAAPLIPVSLEESRAMLVRALLDAPVVPDRASERNAAVRLVDAFVEELDPDAEGILARFGATAAARLQRMISTEHGRWVSPPDAQEVIDFAPLERARTTDKESTTDRFGRFVRGRPYEGWQRSVYGADWFDSEPERVVANTLDASADVERWVRLHRDDFPVVWHADGRRYNADFIAVEVDSTHWVIEVKSDRDAAREDVQAKRMAGRRVANTITDSGEADGPWRYLFLRETDIREAHGSWSAMKSLAS